MEFVLIVVVVALISVSLSAQLGDDKNRPTQLEPRGDRSRRSRRDIHEEMRQAEMRGDIIRAGPGGHIVMAGHPPAMSQADAEEAAHQGQILMQTYEDPKPRVDWDAGAHYPLDLVKLWRRERRLVLFNDKVLLVRLRWLAKANAVKHPGGFYNRGVYKFTPTGEYEAPVAESATDSWEEFTDEERKVADAVLGQHHDSNP